MIFENLLPLAAPLGETITKSDSDNCDSEWRSNECHRLKKSVAF